jgi:Fe/S biogenesis protein NfuA
MSTDHTDGEPLLRITPGAHEKVLGFREQAPDPERQAMWVEITGVSGGEFSYNMSLRPADEAGPGDHVLEEDGLTIVVPAASADKVAGATIEWSDDLFQAGLKLVGMKTPSPEIGGQAPADLSGPVAQRVLRVLEEQVNPAIAAHGGRADLVAAEEGVAYLRLSGGCQGCGMASVTLTQGIEGAIQQAVPEIEQVVDVTDHAAGTNPYFEAAKK